MRPEPQKEMSQELAEMLYTLELCAEVLPFDMQMAHVARLERIKEILKAQEIEQRERGERKPPKLSLLLSPTNR